ncbi:MAG: hypothetical protein ACXWED_03730 [Solirubrobacterales bacterium]
MSGEDGKRRRRIRSGPTMGPKANVSVPISFGLPLLAVGIVLLVAAEQTGATLFWISGAIAVALGLVFFSSGKTL